MPPTDARQRQTPDDIHFTDFFARNHAKPMNPSRSCLKLFPLFNISLITSVMDEGHVLPVAKELGKYMHQSSLTLYHIDAVKDGKMHVTWTRDTSSNPGRG